MSSILAGGSSDTDSKDCHRKVIFINWDQIHVLCHAMGDKGKLLNWGYFTNVGISDW